MQNRAKLWILSVCVGLTTAVAHAVIVGPGNGTQNTTQGSMPSGWNYVGNFRSGTGAYLGNGWGITARHLGSVAVGNVLSLPSGNFTVDQPGVRLIGADGVGVDLQLFHLGATPPLPPLEIPVVSPSAATPIFVVGVGRTPRNVNPTYWDVTGTGSDTTWTVNPDPTSADAGGFLYNTNRVKRWGTNVTRTDPDGQVLTQDIDAGFGPTNMFFADFYTDKDDFLNGGGTASEMQVSSGDSGGGVFSANNELLGITLLIGGFANQPANSAVFGDFSYFANLAQYRDQISAIVPEPTCCISIVAILIFVRTRPRD